jgi:hypothetical protein
MVIIVIKVTITVIRAIIIVIKRHTAKARRSRRMGGTVFSGLL